MDPPPEALVTTATHGAWDGMSSERRRFCSPGRRGTLLQRKSQAHPPTSHPLARFDEPLAALRRTRWPSQVDLSTVRPWTCRSL